ncbi:MAG: hypothetical protein JRF33_19020 [Deltaproteobacteria bacterium]|nr:hypothetical protein [Deltaproteobacteria bacterium]
MKRTKQVLRVALLALFLSPTACSFEPELDLDRYEACGDDGTCAEGCSCLEKWWVCAPNDPKAKPEFCHPAAPECLGNADCDDDEDCTDDRCEEGHCVFIDNNSNECTDDNPCTDDSCEAGICTYDNNSNECTDDNPCTDDSCVGGACASENNDENSCDDENTNTENACRNGECVVVGPDCTVDDDCPLGTWCEPISCFEGSCVVGQRDDDGDGFITLQCEGGTDCDDTLAAVNPDGWEGPYGDPTCTNVVDDDCDGLTEELEAGCQPYEGAVSVDGWRWENPIPTGNTINDLWSDGVSLWAVGEAGTILRWDGSTWESFSDLTDVDLNAVWGCEGDVWVFGDGGYIGYRRDDTEFFLQITGPTSHDLQAAWGRSCADIWAVGRFGTMIQGSSSGWDIRPSIANDLEVDLYGIWGHGDTLWVVGANGPNGFLLHKEGSDPFVDQSADLPEPGPRLSSIWGNEGGEFWIGAEVGRLFGRSEEGSWTAVSTEMNPDIVDVHAAPDGVFYAMDGVGSLWRLDGAGDTVTLVSDEGTGLMRHLWAQSPDRIFAGGTKGLLAVHDGARWRKLFMRIIAYDLNAIHGPPGGAAWAVGNGGTIILRRADGTWTGSGDHGQGTTDLFGICIPIPETGWIVGDGGIVLMRNGGAWQSFTAELEGGFFDVFGFSLSEMVAVGTSGTGGSIMGREDDEFVSLSAQDFPNTLRAVHMISDSGGGYAVGDDGVIVHNEYDAAADELVWRQQDYVSMDNWRSVFQDSTDSAWIVGEGALGGARVSRMINGELDTTEWVQPNTDQPLNAVWGVEGGSVWIAGGGSVGQDEQTYVAFWTGSIWMQEFPGCKIGLNDLWDDRATLFVVGKAGTILSKDIEH